MSKIKNAVVPAVTDEALCAALQTDAGKEVLGLVLADLFATGGWSIPDDAIVGIYANKINQLETQLKSQLDLIKQLAAEVRGDKANPASSGRVDVIAAAAKADKPIKSAKPSKK